MSVQQKKATEEARAALGRAERAAIRAEALLRDGLPEELEIHTKTQREWSLGMGSEYAVLRGERRYFRRRGMLKRGPF